MAFKLSMECAWTRSILRPLILCEGRESKDSSDNDKRVEMKQNMNV